MYREIDLIPYEASDIPSGPWLVFAPHPDDEVFGMGGTMALASQKNIRVDVVVMTKGEKAGAPEIRQKESLRSGEILGVGKYHFWSMPDRGVSLAGINQDELRAVLDSLKPETVFLPGTQEFHPDHRATTKIIWSMLKRNGFTGRVWLYEISRQNEANRLVDITSVIEIKGRAMECFSSQLDQIDYKSMVLGINSSRAYTLPAGITHAEAFWSCGASKDQANPLSAQFNGLDRYRISPVKDHYPLVSIIVRTRNRLNLLEEALESVVRQTYRPIQIILVNDGGRPVPIKDLPMDMSGIDLTYIEHKENLGRAAAANSGIKKVSGEFVCFLDDDDLFYPLALESLLFQADQGRITHARARCLTYGPTGEPDPKSEVFLGEPVDRGRLILENYIPFNTVCIPRAILEKIGFLDETLEIYEDWDLMIRLSRTYEMYFIDSIISEYRIFGSATYTGKGGADKQGFFRDKVLAKHLAEVSSRDILRFVQSSVDKAVLEKDRTINLYCDEVKKLESEIERYKSEIERYKSEIERYKSEIERYKSEIERYKSEIERYIEALNSKDANLADLESQLKAVFSSTSWKITKPLRNFKNLIRPQK